MRYLEGEFWTETAAGCWVWHRAKSRGYGMKHLSNPRRMVYAHRLVYQRLVGPIDPNLELDHLCRARACVNPSHLEQVTRLENIRRGLVYRADPIARLCANGHPWTPATWYRNSIGTMICRTCKRAAGRRYVRKRRQKS